MLPSILVSIHPQLGSMYVVQAEKMTYITFDRLNWRATTRWADLEQTVLNSSEDSLSKKNKMINRTHKAGILPFNPTWSDIPSGESDEEQCEQPEDYSNISDEQESRPEVASVAEQEEKEFGAYVKQIRQQNVIAFHASGRSDKDRLKETHRVEKVHLA